MLPCASQNRNTPGPRAACRKRTRTPLLDDAANLARLPLNSRGPKLARRRSRMPRNRMSAEDIGMPYHRILMGRRGTNCIRMYERNVEFFTKRLGDSRGLRKELRKCVVEGFNERPLRAEVCGEP